MKIIFDNNIWISFLIGKRLAALRSAFSRMDVDIYLLALSNTSNADYLVSEDSDLLELNKYNQTKIVDFETILGLL